jgi:hypothetical protein
MGAARTVSATFTRDRFTLSVNKAGTGGGTVTSTSNPASAGQISCGTSCSVAYDSGTVVTLTAQANATSTFASWSGCDSISGSTCTVTMGGARTVTATFNRQRFTLTVGKSGSGGGTVTSTSSPASATQIGCGSTCSATYDVGTVVTLTAQPDATSTFGVWSGCDSVSGATCTVTINAARSVTARFDKQRYPLTVGKSGTGNGTLTSTSNPVNGTQINCGNTCSVFYDRATVVTLTAQSDSLSSFAGWSGCDSTSGTTCTVTMNAARSVTATFNRLQFTLSVVKESVLLGAGTVTSTSNPASATQVNCGSTCSARYDISTVVTLTATPALGSLFLGWSGCDAASGTTCTVTMSSAKSVRAKFAGAALF